MKIKQAYNWIYQRKKLGEKFSKEVSLEEAREPIEENSLWNRYKSSGKKMGAEPMQEKAVALRPFKKNHRTIRKRKKIGGELIENEFEEQKSRIKDQINELPKQYRKAFLEELLKESE